MELVTGAMGSLLPKLAQLLKDEYGLQKGVKKKIESLSRELEAANTVLCKIGEVPVDQLDKQVRLWASEVREASYDMEDILDTFLVRVEDDCNEPAEPKPNMLRRLRKKAGRLFKKSKARHDISSLIDEINQKLQEVEARRRRYTLDGIVANPVAANTIDPRILNLQKVATEKLVGIEGPRDEVINMLSLGNGVNVSDNKMKIVSIVGFGGLGKTTLAKSVYENLKDGFECQAFVPIGRNPDIKKVFRDILIDLDRKEYMDSKMMMLDVKQLMDELKQFIKGKRCLIVIDDIWDNKTWELVRCALQESKCGGRLVITTRNSEVAVYACEAYKMQPLSHDNSKELLYARIADSEGKYVNPSAEACERNLKKCGGVPLAIITIASLLASKPGEDWSEIYNSIGFGHKGNDVVDNTRKILAFSYYDLPPHLKTCLLYLCVFPEDHVIEKNSLIWMWIGEGFISEEQAAKEGVGSLFGLGERCFHELINRSMIQALESTFEGYVDACSVHDMVLDLIQQLASQENFVTVLNGGERQKPQGSISRRLVLEYVEEHSFAQLTNIAVEKVRSIFGSVCDFCALGRRLPLLRVVYIARGSVSEDCDKHVLDLGSLLHLRYLRLQIIRSLWTKLSLESMLFGQLREVRHLRFLQTLDLRDSPVKQLPEEVGLLTQLVCLRMDIFTLVPAGLIQKLTSLQELCIWCYIEDAPMQFAELGLLRELRVLNASIYAMRWSDVNISLESLGHLHNIQELQVRFTTFGQLSSRPSMYCVSGDAGRLSCRHLRFLSLDSFMLSGLPAWINSSLTPMLTYLHVQVLVLNDQDMKTLAKLPELTCLKLRSGWDTKSVGSIKIGDGVGYFLKLKILRIEGGPSLRFDVSASECNSSRVPSNNSILPSLESLEFFVHVRSLKDENLQLSFDKMLGFQNVGTSSLQSVVATVDCYGAGPREVHEVEAALKHAATVHPKHPTLRSNRILEDHMISSFYQEACMEMSKAPELVTKAWKLADIIVGLRHIQTLCLLDPAASPSEVIRLLYSDNGVVLFAISSNAVHKWWKWESSEKNPCVKSSKSVPPIPWPLEHGILTTKDTTNGKPEQATVCTVLPGGKYYRRDDEILFASGGKFSYFNMMTFELIHTAEKTAPPTAETFIAKHRSYTAIGMEDSSIQIYEYAKVPIVLSGHHAKITGLAFSKSMEVLVSSGADAQLCVWSIDDWEKKESRYIQSPPNFSGALVGNTMIQFHYDQTHILVVHETQLAIYDCQLECLCSWFPRDALPAPISTAVYSLGCLLVYAGFLDGAIGILKAESLTLQCKIAPSVYIPSSISSNGETVYPTAVTTHPWKPNQIAVGMNDGSVLVLEPLHTDGEQGGSNVS